MTIAFAGMTHLGLTSAVAAAARGANVVCFDPDTALIAELDRGETSIKEPDLNGFMESDKERLSYTSEVQDLKACALVVVAPDVPTDDAGNSDLTSLKALIRLVDDALPPETVMVLLSQLPPGFCQALQLTSGRVFYYQVETLIFGQAVDRALNPERIIIGCANPEMALHANYQAFLDLYECPLLPMKYESAELTKIAINCCLVSSISVANTLAELCENIGADWSEIVPALKLDKRIGQYSYLSPGLGIAGGNLERDLNTVMRFAEQYGTDAGVVEAWVKNSRYRRDWVLRLLHEQLLPLVPNPKIAIWGLAYKQDTHSTKNSPSLALIEQLDGFDISVFDPVVPNAAVTRRTLPAHSGALSACASADILIIMTPWAEFNRIDPAAIRASMAGTIIIDPYATLDPVLCTKTSLQYFTLGRQASQID